MTKALIHDSSARREEEVLSLYRTAEESWVEFGIALSKFSADEVYVKLGYTSLKAWATDRRLPYSTIAAKRALIETLTGGPEKIQLSDLHGLSQANAQFMVHNLPDTKWQKHLENAKTMTCVEFYETVKNGSEGAYVSSDRKVHLQWTVPQSLKEQISRCVEQYKKEHEDVQDYIGAIEGIFADWWIEHGGRE